MIEEKLSCRFISMKEDEQTGEVCSLLEVTIGDKTKLVEVKARPHCYGQWGEWVNTSENLTCKYCRFLNLCKKKVLRRYMEMAKEQQDEEIENQIDWDKEEKGTVS